MMRKEETLWKKGKMFTLVCDWNPFMNEPSLAHPRLRRRYLRIAVYALVACSVLSVPSLRGRSRDVHVLFDTSPTSTKTPGRDKTDELTPGVFTLPLFQEYTSQPTRTNVAHAAVVAEFAVPI